MIDKSNQQSFQRRRLNLRQLEVFLATARGGSTRAAADRIARSQSAASTSLAELEAALGVELFDRIGRRLLLNENGRALLPKAQALVEQAAEVQALFTDEHAAPLLVAASFTIGEYLLPSLVAQWTQQHPKSQIHLRIGNTSEVIAAVAALDVDIGFVEGSQTHSDLVVRPWLDDEMVILAAPGHPLANRCATARQLADATWVLREHGSGTRQIADEWLLKTWIGCASASNSAAPKRSSAWWRRAMPLAAFRATRWRKAWKTGTWSNCEHACPRQAASSPSCCTAKSG